MNQKHNEYCLLKTCYLDKDNFTKLRIYGDIFTLPEVRSLYAIMDDNYNRVGDWDRRGIEKIIIESHCMSIEDYHEIIESDARVDKYKYFFELVYLEHLKQKGIEVIKGLSRNVYANINEFRDSINDYLKDLFISEEREIMSIQELLKERLSNMNVPKSKILSGIHYFDSNEGGFNCGELCVIAARPNVGKTAYARNIALTQMKKDLKVGFFSAEMSRDQILDYLVCTEAEQNKIHFENSWLNEKGKQQVIKSMEYLYEKNFFLDDTRCIELEDLKRKARVMKQKYNINSLFIDYLQELSFSTTRYLTEYDKTTKIVMDLAKLSAELKLPIFLLSQINRDSAEGTPKISDLKGSGKIEEAADRVILLEDIKIDDNTSYLDCHVAKNRFGKKYFTYRNYFVKNISKITDLKQVLTKG